MLSAWHSTWPTASAQMEFIIIVRRAVTSANLWWSSDFIVSAESWHRCSRSFLLPDWKWFPKHRLSVLRSCLPRDIVPTWIRVIYWAWVSLFGPRSTWFTYGVFIHLTNICWATTLFQALRRALRMLSRIRQGIGLKVLNLTFRGSYYNKFPNTNG